MCSISTFLFFLVNLVAIWTITSSQLTYGEDWKPGKRSNGPLAANSAAVDAAASSLLGNRIELDKPVIVFPTSDNLVRNLSCLSLYVLL